MQVTSAIWQKHIDTSDKKPLVQPTVVFTTEATSMVKEQQAFVTEHGEEKFPFQFNFVTNTQDITPDSGFMKDIGKRPINRTARTDRAYLIIAICFLSIQQRCCLRCRFDNAIGHVVTTGTIATKNNCR
jgi:hypothetical protein